MNKDIHSDYARAAAGLLDVPIPLECLDGVLGNMRLFLDHAAIVAAADDCAIEPAEHLRP